MKKSNSIHFLRFTCLAVAGSLLALQAGTAADVAPRRPAQAFASYHGTMLPIVGADDQQPRVMSDGDEVDADLPAEISIGLGKEFAAVAVEIQSRPVTGWDMSDEGAVINPDSESINFRGSLTANADLKDVYVVVLIYDAGADLTNPVKFRGTVSEVGTLQGAKPKTFDVAVPAIKEPGPWRSTVLVFADGLEVATNSEDVVVAHHLDALDRATLATKIEKRNGGPNAPLALERNFPVGLSDDLRLAYSGQTVKVRLSVGTDGNVEGVELAEIEDAALQAVLAKQLSLWLFLPAVKGGEAVAQEVVLPLKF